MWPPSSTPPLTGDACGLPSARSVMSSMRWRGRTNSSSSSSPTSVFVAMFGAMTSSCPTAPSWPRAPAHSRTPDNDRVVTEHFNGLEKDLRVTGQRRRDVHDPRAAGRATAPSPARTERRSPATPDRRAGRSASPQRPTDASSWPTWRSSRSPGRTYALRAIVAESTRRQPSPCPATRVADVHLGAADVGQIADRLALAWGSTVACLHGAARPARQADATTSPPIHTRSTRAAPTSSGASKGSRSRRTRSATAPGLTIPASSRWHTQAEPEV